MTEQSEFNHPEWAKDNSLTAPSDRTEKFQADQGAPPLTEKEVEQAMKTLNNTSFVDNFPRVERRYADPPINMQKYGLISFVPAKGAKPNDKGVYGFAKLRGNYETMEEANERAEYIIRNVDSYHQIYHTYVGRPFPITTSSDYSQEVNRVNIQRETAAAISEDVKKKREKEQREIEEIKRKEKELLEDVAKPDDNIDDYYTTLKVKNAQLTWTYSETSKKLKEMIGLMARTRRKINEMDEKHPELKDKYYQKYMEARERAGLPTDSESADKTFMKFLVEDLHIPEVDAEYERLYGSSE